MPDSRAVLFALRDPVLVSVLALHAAAILAAISAPRWVRPHRAWRARVVVLGFALPTAVLLRILAFLAAAPPGTVPVPLAALEFCAAILPFTWIGPLVGGLAWALGSRAGRFARWTPHLLAAASILGLLWTFRALAQAARTWPM